MQLFSRWLAAVIFGLFAVGMLSGCDTEYDCSCVRNNSGGSSSHLVCAPTALEAEDVARSECGDCVCGCFESDGDCGWL